MEGKVCHKAGITKKKKKLKDRITTYQMQILKLKYRRWGQKVY